MLQNLLRLGLLHILSILCLLHYIVGINNLRVLKLNRRELENILPYLENLNRISDIIVVESSMGKILDKHNKDTPNYRRARVFKHMDEDKRRERREEKNQMSRYARLEDAHLKKLNYINETLINRYRPTIYLYNEMKRIIRDRRVYDELRQMIVHLERPDNEKMQRTVLDCYNKVKPQKTISAWAIYETNNLVRNIIKDPMNDNTVD